MATFIAKIKTSNNGLLEFYLAGIETVHAKKYFTTTIDKDTKSHVFYMKKQMAFDLLMQRCIRCKMVFGFGISFGFAYSAERLKQ